MSEHEANNLAELKSIASKNKVIVVDFYATWCGPCVRIAPFVKKLCAENGLTLVKVNVDVGQDVSQTYNIQAMPTFKVLDTEGKEIFTKTGGSEAVVNEIVTFALARK